MLNHEVLHRLTPGIYSMAPEPRWLGRAWAGILIGGPSAVLGYEAAGYLHGFLAREPAEIAVFCAAGRAARPGRRFIEAIRAGSGDPCRTRLDATVIDLAAQADEDGFGR